MSELPAGLTEVVDRVVLDAVETGAVPGVVAGIGIAGTTHVCAAGQMAFGGPQMERDTLFRMSSTSKPIIACLVLRLVDERLLTLDAPVDEWLPELANRRVLTHPAAPISDTIPAERPIRVRDLLTFTWGFGMQGAMFAADPPWPIMLATNASGLAIFSPPGPESETDAQRWMNAMGELPLISQPGERWLYQAGFQLLGILATRAGDAPLDELLHDRILEPWGMADTGFFATDPSRLATAYEVADGTLRVTDVQHGTFAHRPQTPELGSGLVSTVDDMLRFGAVLRAGGTGVLQPSTVTSMTRNQLTPAQQANVWPGFSFLDDRGWGYGTSVTPAGDYGWEGGLGTLWWNIPDRDMTVVVLTQRAADQNGMPAVLDAVLRAAVQA